MCSWLRERDGIKMYMSESIKQLLTIPPPSIDIGMMNSRGDFFIGCLSPEEFIVDEDCMNDCVGVVSDSFDSFVDWRDNVLLFLEENVSLD